MSFTETQDYSWTELMRSLHHIITAKPNAMAWTEAELARAVGARHFDEPYDGLSYHDVSEACSQLFLGGHIIPAFPEQGWRRA